MAFGAPNRALTKGSSITFAQHRCKKNTADGPSGALGRSCPSGSDFFFDIPQQYPMADIGGLAAILLGLHVEHAPDGKAITIVVVECCLVCFFSNYLALEGGDKLVMIV